MPIKNIHKIEQPREKLEKYGADKLSDAELFAVLLRTGPKGSGGLELAKKILRQYSGAMLANAGFDELQKIHGLGQAKAFARYALGDEQSASFRSRQCGVRKEQLPGGETAGVVALVARVDAEKGDLQSDVDAVPAQPPGEVPPLDAKVGV